MGSTRHEPGLQYCEKYTLRLTRQMHKAVTTTDGWGMQHFTDFRYLWVIKAAFFFKEVIRKLRTPSQHHWSSGRTYSFLISAAQNFFILSLLRIRSQKENHCLCWQHNENGGLTLHLGEWFGSYDDPYCFAHTLDHSCKILCNNALGEHSFNCYM